MAKKRKTVTVLVTLSLAPGVSKAQGIRELRTRTNDLCCYALDDEDVRVRSAKGVRA